jgi:hypothetical protein
MLLQTSLYMLTVLSLLCAVVHVQLLVQRSRGTSPLAQQQQQQSALAAAAAVAESSGWSVARAASSDPTLSTSRSGRGRVGRSSADLGDSPPLLLVHQQQQRSR